jgi:LysR family transcriptional regulator, carnitine catabolism transcriptional activator
MREFRKLRPDVQIQLFDADLPTLIQMVEAGKLDMSLGIFKAMPDVRRESFFRFSLMVARAVKDDIQPRKTTTWPALEGETLIALSPGHPHQQLIDKHLAQAGVKVQTGPIVNLLDTQIALVEAEEGIAIIPSFGMPACRNRKITTSQLIHPVVRFNSHDQPPRRRAATRSARVHFLSRELHCYMGRTRRCALSLALSALRKVAGGGRSWQNRPKRV